MPIDSGDGKTATGPNDTTSEPQRVSDYLGNWSSTGDFWTTVSSGSGIPTIKLGKLSKALGLGTGLAVFYGIIEFVRQGAIQWGKLATDATDYGLDVVSSVFDPNKAQFQQASGAAQSQVSTGVEGFVLAFLAMLAAATLVWVITGAIRS